MNPNYIHTITLYQRKERAWIRNVLYNCFWKSGISIIQNGTSAVQKNTYTVRIPLEVAGAGFSASDGDIVILGECSDIITGKSPYTATEIMQKYKPNAFKITAFADNTGHKQGKHYRLGG